jgi:hypothetical protein
VESQAQYLNGGVLCETTMQYINNFFCVNRLRPVNAEHDEANSDDLLSDEDVQLSTEDLAHVLQTRIGGREAKEGPTGKRGTDDDDTEANTHHENSSTAMDLAQDIWGLAEGKKDRKNPTFRHIPRNLDEVFRAAARSQSCAVEATARTLAAERPADLSTRRLPSESEMRRWQEGAAKDLNVRQRGMLGRVVDRVAHETKELFEGGELTSEPFLHLLVGFPGVGKSYVLKKVKDFFVDVMQWKTGVEFQYAALQAVMAIEIGGPQPAQSDHKH